MAVTTMGPPPNRWGTIGLGVLTAVLTFGITLSLLMTLANPRANTPIAASPGPGIGMAEAVPAASQVPPRAPADALSAAPRAVQHQASRIEERIVTHGDLAIKAEPATAEVLVDGRSVGNAPYEGVLEAGMHHVRLQAEGFQPWDSEVEIVIGEQQTLNVILSKDETAKVDVSRRRSKRHHAKKKSSDKTPGDSTSAPPSEAEVADATPPPEPATDRKESSFKKLGASDSGSGFKKLGSGSKSDGFKKLK